MKQFVCALAAACVPLAIPVSALGAPPGRDISGVYECSGRDEHLGAYEERYELRLDPTHHASNSHGYSTKGYMNGALAYTGEAIAVGKHVAVNFMSSSDKTDHGTVIGTLDFKAPIKFKGEYFESLYSGGNSGTIMCSRTGD